MHSFAASIGRRRDLDRQLQLRADSRQGRSRRRRSGLVELHDGLVCGTSPGIGQGSEFTVTLPSLIMRPTEASRSEPLPAPTRRRASDAGFEVHLTKPIDIDELEKIIERLSSST